MPIKQIFRKSTFFLVSAAVLVASFLLCWMGSAILFAVNSPEILGSAATGYVFWNGVIFFSTWGPVAFFTFLIYYFSVFFAFLGVRERASTGRTPILVSFLFAALLFQLQEAVVPYAGYQNGKAEYLYQYARLYYNEGVSLFESGSSILQRPEVEAAVSNLAEKRELTDAEVLQSRRELESGVDHLIQYLDFDPSGWLDEQALLYQKTGEGAFSGRGESSRSSWNHQPVVMLLRQMNAALDQLRLRVVEPEYRGEMTPELKFRSIDRANILLDSARKENNLRKAVQAWEIFDRSRQKDGSDIEFKEGCDVARDEVERLSFYRDDVRLLFEMPVARDLLIVRNREAEGEFLYRDEMVAGAMVVQRGAVYFREVFLRRINSRTGKVLMTLSSDFAALREGRLMFASLEKRIDEDDLKSGRLVKERGNVSVLDSVPFEIPEILLPYLSRADKQRGRLGLYQITSLLSYYEKGDPRRSLLEIELLERCVGFVILLIFPLILILLSARLKPKEEKRPWWLIALFPVPVLSIYLCWNSFLHFSGILISFLVLAASIVTAAVVIGILYGAVSIAVIILFLVRSKKGTL